jgi:predicted nucleic acid-binding protein
MTPRRVFTDTGAWFAAPVVDDAHHEEAASALRGLIALPVVLVTTNRVAGETCALLRGTRGYGACRRLLESIEETKRLERIRRAFAFHSHCAAAGFMRVPADVGIGQLGDRL